MVGGPCDYCVSPSPKNWVFGFVRLGLDQGQDLGPVGTGDWGLGLGLDNYCERDIFVTFCCPHSLSQSVACFLPNF